MLINEVEHKVGLSKKSIRFYEDANLLTPKRNAENDYRIYDEEDIKKLKLIKFLRDLGVPIKDLQKLNEGMLSLEECMQDRISKIDDEEVKFTKVKEMCKEIIKSKVSFKEIDITEYFKEMNILGKEGFTMRDVKKNNGKKILGACLATLVFSILILFIPLCISYFQFTEVEKMPWIIYTFLMILFAFPFIGMIINLITRIREIKGGEEDEASKY